MADPFSSLARVPVHIEAQLKAECVVPIAEVKAHIQTYIKGVAVWRLGPLALDAASHPLLAETLQRLEVAEMGGSEDAAAISSWRALPLVHLYALQEQRRGGQDFALSDDDEGAPTAFSAFCCPCEELNGVWESIHVAAETKQALLALSATATLFSMRGVDPHLISGNRLILLEGPPGTGKSTLARGLAQKLAIRHGETFPGGVQLLGVNAHALVSKYFGESSFNVGRCFSFIRERVAEEQSSLFVVVVDEVETICASREAALARGSSEPSDAVRVVNAALTEIDRLRSFCNVLVIATSNITGALDSAFLDRVDLRLRVGLPTTEGRWLILRSTLQELMRTQIVTPVPLPQRFELLLHTPGQVAQELLRLVELTGMGGGLSGRALRKLPLQAHALIGERTLPPVPVLEFIQAMTTAAETLVEMRAAAGGGGNGGGNGGGAGGGAGGGGNGGWDEQQGRE